MASIVISYPGTLENVQNKKPNSESDVHVCYTISMLVTKTCRNKILSTIRLLPSLSKIATRWQYKLVRIAFRLVAHAQHRCPSSLSIRFSHPASSSRKIQYFQLYSDNGYRESKKCSIWLLVNELGNWTRLRLRF